MKTKSEGLFERFLAINNLPFEKTKEDAPKIKLLRGEHHRDRVVTPDEEARYLAATGDLMADVATVLIDTGMRPEENSRLRWESISWTNGQYGTVQITHGKTAAARRIPPMSPRVRSLLGRRWRDAGQPFEGWVWPAPTKSGHLEPSTVKKQHARALKLSGVRRSCSILFGILSLQDSARLVATPAPLRGSQVTPTSPCPLGMSIQVMTL